MSKADATAIKIQKKISLKQVKSKNLRQSYENVAGTVKSPTFHLVEKLANISTCPTLKYGTEDENLSNRLDHNWFY
jgi:hypothetical protein